MELPVAKSTRRSMLGKGNSSLGHALSRSQKSTQQRIWLFFFFTRTILESHWGCWIGLMNPSANNFLTSWVIWASTLVRKTLAGWIISLILGSILRKWTTSLGSRSGISSYVHANTSTYLFSNSTNCSFSFADNWLLIKTGLGGPKSTRKFISSNSSLGWIYASFSTSFGISSWAIMKSSGPEPSCEVHSGPTYLQKRYINLLDILDIPALLDIPGILRNWPPSFASSCPGDPSNHECYPLLLLLRQVPRGSLAWDIHHLVLTHHKIQFLQSSLLFDWRVLGWQWSLWASHLASLSHIGGTLMELGGAYGAKVA